MKRSIIRRIVALRRRPAPKKPPTDRLRVSGHVEATETRLAPEAGGRILTLTVKEGDRVQPGQTVLTLDTRDVQLAIDRAKAEQAAAEAQLRLVQAGARVEDIRQAQAQVETARAEVVRGANPSCRPPSRTSSASTRCSRTTPARASSETMRRRGGTWRGIGWRPPRAA